MDWTIAAWIAGLLFVYIFGLVEGRGKGYKKRKAEEEQEKKDQRSPTPETVTVDDPGLLRIKNQDGAVTLDLDGQRVNPSALSADQRKRLIELLNIMRPWLEGRSAPAPSTTTPVSSPPPKPRLSPAVTPSINVEQPHARSATVPNTSPPSQPTPRPSASKPAVISAEDRPSAPANSIVSQIDSILQMHLIGTPLEERGIFLTQSPEGGVIVYVGLTRYNGIDEVPDPEIKTAIRAAITEWENKYTPGL